MNKLPRLRLVIIFAALTLVLTVLVVYGWEWVVMGPLYSQVRLYYPGPENAELAWKVAQRIEHFVISVVVDLIVVTLLLKMVDNQQKRLTLSEERYRNLFDNDRDGIGVLAEDGRILDVNKRFCELLDSTPQDVLDRRMDEFIPSPAATGILGRGSDGSLRGEGEEAEIEVGISLLNAIPVGASLSAVSTDTERLVVVRIRDLRERKRLEAEKAAIQQQLFQSSRLASIGELSAGVAHEINNPLNCIINFAQLLKDDPTGRTEVERRMIDGIIDEGDRIASIVRSLLTFARQDDPSQAGRVEVAGLIRNSLSLFSRQLEIGGIRLELDLGDESIAAAANAPRLRQVIVNMISNACQALRDSEKDERLLRITVRRVKRLEGDIVAIEFFDNGVGVARENLGRIFDPFFTTRRDSGGTGLGLSLSFGIVREYGGTISIDSEEGGYTKFVVELPAAGDPGAQYAEGAISRRRTQYALDDGRAAQA